MKPFIVTDLEAGKLPRWALLLLCALYVLPGFIGRDPWRTQDAAGFGIALSMIRGDAADWLMPNIGNLPVPSEGPLPFWIAASIGRFAAPLIGEHAGVRLAVAAVLALALMLAWYAAWALARRPGVQPSDPFGASASSIDYGRAIADSALLVLMATFGLLVRMHETTADPAQVAWIAARVGERLGLTGGEMQSLIAGSFLHDVGKIGIPDAILLKPGKLDDDEFRIMRTHVGQGEEIVTGMGWLHGANAVVAAHHEKWNGTGYPRQLKGEAIPLAARIFAVADVFDALCSKRPYKEPMSFEAAMAILEKDTGSHFDPTVMAEFRALAPEIHQRLATCGETEVRQLLEECVREHFEM